MWFPAAVAWGGQLIVDVRVPAEIYADNQPVAEVYRSSVLSLPWPTGKARFTVFVEGKPHYVEIEIPEVGDATLLIGRTGITTSSSAQPEPPISTATSHGVDFRVVGSTDVLLQLGENRHRVSSGAPLHLALPEGPHALMLRDASGTVIWARGTLIVGHDDPIIVQLSEGRLPEVSGGGSSYQSTSR